VYKNYRGDIAPITMNSHKTFRHGKILRLVVRSASANQEELRRGWPTQKLPRDQPPFARPQKLG